MRIFGIDPGSERTGYGCVETDGSRHRIVLCGAVSQYYAASPPPGPRNLGIAIQRRLRLEGFIVIDHLKRFPEFVAEVAPLIASGELKAPATFVDGLDKAPAAFMQILRPNASVGKMVVRIA